MEPCNPNDKVQDIYFQLAALSRLMDKNDTFLLLESYHTHLPSLKANLQEQRRLIEMLETELESLSWLNDLTSDELEQIQSLIKAGRSWETKLLANYKMLAEQLDLEKIDSDDVALFRKKIEDFRESLDDLYSVIFELPQNFEMLSLTHLIEALG